MPDNKLAYCLLHTQVGLVTWGETMKNISWCLMVISMMACGEFEPHTLHGDHPEVTAADDIVVTEKGSYTRKWVWLTREIPVCWERRPFLFRAHRKVVKTAIEGTWGREIMAKFTGWGTCTESSMGIRIRVSDEAPHTKGLGSQLDGKKDGMVLNFFFRDWCTACADDYVANIRSIAVHGFGHALGLTTSII